MDKTTQPCGAPEGGVLSCRHRSMENARDISDDGTEAIKSVSIGCFATLLGLTQTLAAPSAIVMIVLKHDTAQGAADALRSPRDFTMSCLRNNARNW